jgi:hypothetical protein
MALKTPIDRLRDSIESLLRLGALAVGAAYGGGFLLNVVYYTGYGIVFTSPLRPQNILAGCWLFFPFAIAYLLRVTSRFMYAGKRAVGKPRSYLHMAVGSVVLILFVMAVFLAPLWEPFSASFEVLQGRDILLRFALIGIFVLILSVLLHLVTADLT